MAAPIKGQPSGGESQGKTEPVTSTGQLHQHKVDPTVEGWPRPKPATTTEPAHGGVQVDRVRRGLVAGAAAAAVVTAAWKLGLLMAFSGGNRAPSTTDPGDQLDGGPLTLGESVSRNDAAAEAIRNALGIQGELTPESDIVDERGVEVVTYVGNGSVRIQFGRAPDMFDEDVMAQFDRADRGEVSEDPTFAMIDEHVVGNSDGWVLYQVNTEAHPSLASAPVAVIDRDADPNSARAATIAFSPASGTLAQDNYSLKIAEALFPR